MTVVAGVAITELALTAGKSCNNQLTKRREEDMDNICQEFKQSTGKWSLALFEVGLLVSERAFEVATLAQYAQNEEWIWFRLTLWSLYFPPYMYLATAAFNW